MTLSAVGDHRLPAYASLSSLDHRATWDLATSESSPSIAHVHPADSHRKRGIFLGRAHFATDLIVAAHGRVVCRLEYRAPCTDPYNAWCRAIRSTQTNPNSIRD